MFKKIQVQIRFSDKHVKTARFVYPTRTSRDIIVKYEIHIPSEMRIAPPPYYERFSIWI